MSELTPEEAKSRLGHIMCVLRESGGGYIHNRKLGALLGRDETDIYGELISEEHYWEKEGMLTEDGYFFCTIKNLEEATQIGRHPQDNAIKHLAELGLIKMETRTDGNFKKRYFMICKDENHLRKFCPPIKKTGGDVP